MRDIKCRIFFNGFITIRAINGESVVQDDAWSAITNAADFTMEHFGNPGHLFITVLPASQMGTSSEDEDDVGIGLYHSGIRHVTVCAGDTPAEIPGGRDQWLQEIVVTTIHEIVHYIQELDGILDGSEESEADAEAQTRTIYAKFTSQTIRFQR